MTLLHFHSKLMSLKLSGSQYADEETEANHIPKTSMILLFMFILLYLCECLPECMYIHHECLGIQQGPKRV